MRLIVLFVCIVFSLQSKAQQQFSIRLTPSNLNSVPALHSGAFGSYEGKWFFIGGRKNGLHGFLPPSAFTETGVVDTIYIVDPLLNQQWSVDVYSLPDSIREAITTSNMQFCMRDSFLYMVGGYGFNAVLQDFITYQTLTAINLRQLYSDIINGQPIAHNFRQIKDSVLAVCGAHMALMDSVFYLVFGHRYDGYYDRLGTLGIATQTYTNEIRKFKIIDDGNQLLISDYTTLRDTNNFHRRDYNLIPFHDPYRGDGLLAYSGVFRKDANLPFLNCVEIFPDTVITRNDFNQNLSQYHSACAPLYDSTAFLQHHLFFGGMSMYYIDSANNQQVYDSLVPFVNTISDVVRDIDLNYHEFDAGVKMPGLLGTNAYFFLDEQTPIFRKHHVHLNNITLPYRIGFLTGGIESMEPNIADNNPNANSFASQRIFEVWLDSVSNISSMTALNNTVLNFIAYPNPSREFVNIKFELKVSAIVQLNLVNAEGKIMKSIVSNELPVGEHGYKVNITDIPTGVYGCMIQVKNNRKFIRLVKR